MNTPVNFETAKLLKEKGFDLPCRLLYKSEKELEEGIGVDYDWNRFNSYSAPTIAEVVMWVYEKHGVWIKSDVISINKVIKFYCSYYKIVNGFTAIPSQLDGNFNTPTEAYEAAISYTLKNLI